MRARTSPSYRSRIEGRSRQSTRRLSMVFRAVSVLGVLCILAAGLASAFSLVVPPSVAHGSVQSDGAGNAGMAGSTRLLADIQPGRMLVPNAMWLGEGTNFAADKSVGSVQDVAVRAAASKSPPVAQTPAPGTGGTKLGVASAGGTSAAKSRSRGTVTIETFGYSFDGSPGGSEFVADVRNIPAAAFDFRQDENGLMPSVRTRVMSTSEAQTWRSVMRTRWMPTLGDGDKVAIGCARGHHRSVTLAVLFAEDLRAAGYTVVLVHRDISKTW